MISYPLKKEKHLHIYNIYTQMFTHRHTYSINQNLFYNSVWKSVHFYASKFHLLFKIVIFNLIRHVEIKD